MQRGVVSMFYGICIGYWVVILHILEGLALLGCCAAQGGTDMLSLNPITGY